MIEDLISLKNPPNPSEVLECVDRYQLVRLLGKGGMGEVYLAYDPLCGRYIALKRIQKHLLKHKNPRRRFIREARITSQLTHSAIIPIYSIQIQSDKVYYTMPYIEGNTFRELLYKALQVARRGDDTHPQTALPSLLRIFLQICRGISYAHAQGILHRDIKPENVMCGQYGEIFILDWGVAQPIHAHLYGDSQRHSYTPAQGNFSEQEQEVIWSNHPSQPEQDLSPTSMAAPEHSEKNSAAANLTIAGKVVGTMTYLSPERALGSPATIESDVYSLGVILYQILALKPPFKRKNLKHFRQHWQEEQWVHPSITSPYRDVPPLLAEITRIALEPSAQNRYHSVEDLIEQLSQYLDGRSQWHLLTEIDPQKSQDWIFQENILLNSYRAFSHHLMEPDWGILMISQEGFRGSIKLETTFSCHPNNHGIGVLLSIPSAPVPHLPTEGYILWLSSTQTEPSRLIRSGVVVHILDLPPLEKGVQYHLILEKNQESLLVYLNTRLICQHTSRLPLLGQQIGLLYRDKEFFISPLRIYVNTWNIQVSCLAIPDSFLVEGLYEKAIQEYRRIANAFPGSKEARQAFFSAGLALIELGEKGSNPEIRQQYFDRALEEFESLRNTAAAPLEYLGKALIYQKFKDPKEELKCFELACRRYANHPLLNTLYEQITYRLYHNTYTDRIATYELIYLIAYQIPHLLNSTSLNGCLTQLLKEWEGIWFLPQIHLVEDLYYAPEIFATHLAIWLQKSYPLYCLFNQASSPATLAQLTIALLFCGQHVYITNHEKFGLLPSSLQLISRIFDLPQDNIVSLWLQAIEEEPSSLHQQLVYLIHYGIIYDQKTLLEQLIAAIEDQYLQQLFPPKLHFEILLAKLYCKIPLTTHNINILSGAETSSHLDKKNNKSPLTFILFCYRNLTPPDLSIQPVPYPRLHQLGLQALAGNFGNLYDSLWLQHAVGWERYSLFLQLLVYETHLDHFSKADYYRLRLKEHFCAT
jgi:serine/threonine-protein kinase